MSSSDIKAINSGPLIIRTYNQSYNTLSTTNTYLLGQYETPIPSNYILITTLNGQLAPTNHPIISSINISTSHINNGLFSTFTGSTITNKEIQTSSIITSTLYVDKFANFRYDTNQIALGTDLDIRNLNFLTYFGKYNFINPDITDKDISLLYPPSSDSSYNGTFMVFKNINNTNLYFTVKPVDGNTSGYVVHPLSTIKVVWNNDKWYSV
jgi:hypothetical protein